MKNVLLQIVKQEKETERDKGIESNLCNFFGRDHVTTTPGPRKILFLCSDVY